MTNRLILNDPQMGQPPSGQRGWTFFQRQLAAHTAPGYTSRVVLSNVTVSTTTWTTLLISPGSNASFSASLLASTRYYFELFGTYNRESTSGVDVRLTYTGTTAGTPEDSSFIHYHSSVAGAEFQDTTYDPLESIGILLTTAASTGFTFKWEGFISATTAGTLAVEWKQRVVSGVNDATMYAGTRLIIQPIINIAEQSG